MMNISMKSVATTATMNTTSPQATIFVLREASKSPMQNKGASTTRSHVGCRPRWSDRSTVLGENFWWNPTIPSA